MKEVKGNRYETNYFTYAHPAREKGVAHRRREEEEKGLYG
jgi:hypothetical protein